jgi:serine/threonine-protein kinase
VDAGRFCPDCLSAVAELDAACASCGLRRPARGWPRDASIGRIVNGKYRLEARLGAGGFGRLFRARQVHGEVDLGDVVLKFLLPEREGDLCARRRLLDEVRAARSVQSPHVVKVFDVDFDEEGQPFLVMESLHGESLHDLLARERALAPMRALRLAMQVASALEECHQAGVVHRDLKPQNLLVLSSSRGEDFAKVLDFGIARLPSARAGSTARLAGTPPYMAPEQIRGEPVDGGADIFALGVILYECLCGAPPIDAETPSAYYELNVSVTPRPLREREPSLPGALERLIGRMLAKRRVDRPPSMADVEARLRAIAAEAGWLARGTGIAAGTRETQDVLLPGAAGDRRQPRSRLPRFVAPLAVGLLLGAAGTFALVGEDARGRAVAVRPRSTMPTPQPAGTRPRRALLHPASLSIAPTSGPAGSHAAATATRPAASREVAAPAPRPAGKNMPARRRSRSPARPRAAGGYGAASGGL